MNVTDNPTTEKQDSMSPKTNTTKSKNIHNLNYSQHKKYLWIYAILATTVAVSKTVG